MPTYRATITLEVRADDDDLALALAYGALRPEVAGDAPVLPADPDPKRIQLVDVSVTEALQR